MNRRDFMKTTGGLVLATGGAWAAGHARATDSLPGPPEHPQAVPASSVPAQPTEREFEVVPAASPPSFNHNATTATSGVLDRR